MPIEPTVVRFNRGIYFLCLLGVWFTKELIFYCATTFGIPDMSAGAAVFLMLIVNVLMIWATIYRCYDLGIKWGWAFLIYIPFMPLYFIFKRGEEYRLWKQVHREVA